MTSVISSSVYRLFGGPMNVNVPVGFSVPTKGKPELSAYHSNTLAHGWSRISKAYVFGSALTRSPLAGGWSGFASGALAGGAVGDGLPPGRASTPPRPR